MLIVLAYFFLLFKVVLLLLLSIMLLSSVFILYFFFNLLKKNKIKIINQPNNHFKEKDYIFFKFSLFNFYSISLILLFISIFKFKGLDYFLFLDSLSFFSLFLTGIIYSVLFSNSFNLTLFKIYKKIKAGIKLLKEIEFEPFIINNFSYNKLKKNNFNQNSNLHYQTKNFSSSASIKNDISLNKFEDQIFFPDSSTVEDSDIENINLEKTTAIKNFKKKYGGGYLGYNHVYNLGNVSTLVNADNSVLSDYIKNLEPKIKIYLSEIPENFTFSVLPVLR
jgi:hypothetical protein